MVDFFSHEIPRAGLMWTELTPEQKEEWNMRAEIRPKRGKKAAMTEEVVIPVQSPAQIEDSSPVGVNAQDKLMDTHSSSQNEE